MQLFHFLLGHKIRTHDLSVLRDRRARRYVQNVCVEFSDKILIGEVIDEQRHARSPKRIEEQNGHVIF